MTLVSNISSVVSSSKCRKKSRADLSPNKVLDASLPLASIPMLPSNEELNLLYIEWSTTPIVDS